MIWIAPTPSSMSEGGANPGPSNLYLQHPQSGRLGEEDIVPGTSFEPVNVGKAGSFFYEQLRKPRTASDLVARCMEHRESLGFETGTQIESFLQAMVERGLVIEIPPSAFVPIDPHSAAKQLLWDAQQRLRAGDWSTAVALCREAGQDPAFAAVAELNIIIARFHGGSLDGVIEPACTLSAQLTGASQACCGAIALLVAHRTGDLETAKLVALQLSRRYTSPWDLPTVPNFAFQLRGQLAVLESFTVEPMLAALETLLSAQAGSPEESALLKALAQRYRERRDKSAKT